MDVAQRIVAVLVDDLGWDGDPATLHADLDLIEHGVLDSLRLIEFISFLEHRFAIEVPDDQVVADSFRTIAAVAALVTSKLP